MGQRAKCADMPRLVRQAQKGDRAAFDELYRATAQVQYFVIASKVGRDAAPDILLDLYLITWQNIDSIKPAAFVGYLNATANNLCKRHFKGQGTSKVPLPAEDEFLEAVGAERAVTTVEAQDPAHQVDFADERNRLARVLLEDLDDQERAAVLLRYYQGMKLDDMAAALQISRATVKRLLNRALTTLRRKLGFLPGAVELTQLVSAAVESDLAPHALLRLEGVQPGLQSQDFGRAANAFGALSVLLTVVAVVFAVQAKWAAANPLEEADRPADVTGPELVECRTEAGDTLLVVSDGSGAARVWCAGTDGKRYEAVLEMMEDSAQSLWRASLPSGCYELHAVDSCGNESQGMLQVAVTPDVL